MSKAKSRKLARFELRDLQNRIRYGDGESPNPIIDELQATWLEDFVPTSRSVRDLFPDPVLGCQETSWESVHSRLVESSQKIQVKVINGAAKDALDYWDHPEGLSAIAIGGDKLSRGLTLEGLSVSYYLRASRMYDTLLQMGRWFGYRPGYVDLCRLYTTDELRDFYSHITMATSELRQEFDLMADRGMTPSEFGLRVRNHPAGLVITASNKMRHGTPMTVSYSADISETISFDRSPEINRRNHERFGRFIQSMGCPESDRLNNRIWRGVAGEQVADLLEDISVHQGIPQGPWRLSRKIHPIPEHPWGIDQLVCGPDFQSKGRESYAELGELKVYPLHRAPHPPDSSDLAAVYRIRRLVSPTDEMIDLTDDQRKLALDRTVRQHQNHPAASRHRDVPKRPSGPNIRRVRYPKNGLLLLYPVRETRCRGTAICGLRREFSSRRQRYANRILCEYHLPEGGPRGLNVAEVWKHLEVDAHITEASGRMQRRIRPAGRRNFFLGLEMPSRNRMLVLRVFGEFS